MTSVSTRIFDALRAGIHERCFTPVHEGPSRVGAEVEFLALDALSRAPVPLQSRKQKNRMGSDPSDPDLEHGLFALVRRHAGGAGWSESSSPYRTPRFDVPGRATLSFEPGGQIEIATIACESASGLLALLDSVVAPLRLSLARDGVILVGKGIDPSTPVEDVELQLRVDRYERMTRYFDRIGPYGIRMMRQTAAVQISLDRGARPAERWRLLNDLAPYIVALFANSSQYAGVDTGHRSYRARCWRLLDPSRTGVSHAAGGDPATEYTRFALEAGDMMRLTPGGEYRSFQDWVAAGEWTDDGWQRHLTTLFPEIRPRGHFEVRSCDGLDPSLYPAVIVFLCGLAYDPVAAAEATRLVAGSGALLARAGEAGLGDASIARTVSDLVELSLDGAARLGPSVVQPDDVAVARDLLYDLTARGVPGGSVAPSPSLANSWPTI